MLDFGLKGLSNHTGRSLHHHQLGGNDDPNVLESCLSVCLLSHSGARMVLKNLTRIMILLVVYVCLKVHYTEISSIEKGIIALTLEDNVRRLVMVATAYKHYSLELKHGYNHLERESVKCEKMLFKMKEKVKKQNEELPLYGSHRGVHYTEMSSIEKGIVALTLEDNVRRLVMVATAYKHYSL
nr:U-box domain-containing protein kinase family protein [Tanacetum cinerariifolium]